MKNRGNNNAKWSKIEQQQWKMMNKRKKNENYENERKNTMTNDET